MLIKYRPIFLLSIVSFFVGVGIVLIGCIFTGMPVLFAPFVAVIPTFIYIKIAETKKIWYVF